MIVNMSIRDVRKNNNITQIDAAKLLGVSRRTFINYEQNEDKLSEVKKEFIISVLEKQNMIDESHGVLSLNTIKDVCEDVFKDFDVQYGYLFGSYAKNKATATSDVDLLVAVPIDGLKFFDLIETLRERLHKKVDLLDFAQLKNNEVLLNVILKDGIKIYR